jgi:phosphate transport system substrate-binding protein
MTGLVRAGIAALLAGGAACSSAHGAAAASIRVTGSDTMVNLVQAWAEKYAVVRPSMSVQVTGGGSGVGIAGLINGTLDVAAISRDITADEISRIAARTGTRPVELVVALDALAIYVHPSNPLDSISLDDLAAIYGEGGRLNGWSRLGARHASFSRTRVAADSQGAAAVASSDGRLSTFRESLTTGRDPAAGGQSLSSGIRRIASKPRGSGVPPARASWFVP